KRWNGFGACGGERQRRERPCDYVRRGRSSSESTSSEIGAETGGIASRQARADSPAEGSGEYRGSRAERGAGKDPIRKRSVHARRQSAEPHERFGKLDPEFRAARRGSFTVQQAERSAVGSGAGA